MPLRPRKAETIGRPVGDEAFLNALERQFGRRLQPLKRGPRPRQLNALSP
jgi:putative transposase